MALLIFSDGLEKDTHILSYMYKRIENKSILT